MRVREILDKDYSPRVSVHLDGVAHDDIEEIAGMLRGLMCSIEGWGAISGITNDKFDPEQPLILSFSDVENAHYFKTCVEYYFNDTILEDLRVKKRVYKDRKKNGSEA